MQIRKLLAGLAASSALLTGAGLATAALAPAAHATTVLVGDSTVESGTDSISGTNAEAFAYTATATGTIKSIQVYLDSTNGVKVGLYTQNNGPNSQVEQGSVSSNSAGWVDVPMAVGSTSIQLGQTWWLVLSPYHSTDTLSFRDTASGTGTDWVDYSDGLPSTFTKDTQFTNDPASIYAQDS